MTKQVEQRHVLVLDDDPYINELIISRLGEIDIRVTTFENPELFLKEFKSLSPDLCLLDLNLGKEGIGYLVLQAIRRVIGNKIPIIIISARDDSDDIAKAFELGANDYMVKPFRKTEFQEKVTTFLNNENTQKEYYYKVPSKNNDCFLSLNSTLKAVNEDIILIESPYMLRKNTRVRIEGEWAHHLGFQPPYPKIHGTIIKNSLNYENRLFETVIKVDFFQDELQEKFIRFFDQKK